MPSKSNPSDLEGKSVDSTLRLEYQRVHTVYTDEDYQDRFGNNWIIRISGLAHVVRAFIKKGRLEVEAEPIDEGTWRELVEKLRSHHSDEKVSFIPKVEIPSLDIYATLVRNHDSEGQRLRIRYMVYVPYAGNSHHSHTVYVGSDNLASILFNADKSPITLHMGRTSVSGLSGSIDWETKNTTISLSVYEEGTGYKLEGDGVTPPA